MTAVSASRAPERLAQFVLGALQRALACGRQVLAGAIEIEDQHRQRRAVRIRFAAFAALGRALERSGDALWVLPGEDALIEVERVARARHPGGPAAGGFARRLANGRPGRLPRGLAWR